VTRSGAADAPWWRDPVIYQIYVRSFADSDGDGVGDLPGVRSRLPYVRELGVDAIWLNPFYPSPQADAGYDVTDYREVDPVLGSLDDLDKLVRDAHASGLRVLIDLVPNHTSSEHAWFRAALAAPPGSGERARYIFRDGRGLGGETPPNDWGISFGGRAWTRVTEPDGSPGQCYLHLFAPGQPDLDWTNDEVRAEFESILRFWFDRGVDGFRIDVAHGLSKDPEMPDLAGNYAVSGPATEGHPYWDRDEVHDVYRGWRRVSDSYPATEPSSPRCGCRNPSGSRCTYGPRSSIPRSTSASCSRCGTPRACARPLTRASRRSLRWGRPQPGCCPTTTSFATSRGTAAASCAGAGPGLPPCCCSPCPGCVRLPGRGARPARGHRAARRDPEGPGVRSHRWRGP
jgi:hypothetical protein